MTLGTSEGQPIAGEDYTLTCMAMGGGTTITTYRWWKDNVLITDQTERMISYNPIAQITSGVFMCEATRGSMSMSSAPVTITVMSEC